MRTKQIEICGKKYRAALTMEAQFEILEALEIENLGTLAKLIEAGTRESFERLLKVTEILNRNGIAVRAYLGFEPGEAINIDALRMILTRAAVGETYFLRNQVIETIGDGLKREQEEEEEIDEGLMELQQKKTKKQSQNE